MSDERKRRYENYLNRAIANGWDDQVEHWTNLLEEMEKSDGDDN